ncbi:MAG TPA: FAD-binding oxidoreductase [Longimicrobiales bacterium]|nr:FAD-binding oxidoreductase [Longimicrobiales bacterium]
MISRRRFLELAARVGTAAAVLPGCRTPVSSTPPSGGADSGDAGRLVNDIHSQLNATRVRAIHRPTSVDGIQSVIAMAAREQRAVCIAAGRHAMGGQQFAAGAEMLDMNGLARVLEFDRAQGEIEVEAGIQWPELYAYLTDAQRGEPRPWTFVQKQTGADRLSIGGALAANVHGRGLTYAPFVGDVAAFTLVDANGTMRRCSRTENAELFRLAIGGYGLFGAIASVRLRLAPRHAVRRVVEVIDAADLPAMFTRRIAEGFQYGDFQFATDLDSDGLLSRGVLSCYAPTTEVPNAAEARRHLSGDDWTELLYLAHVDHGAAFERYAGYYLTTTGQVYWSDEHQMANYVDDYHAQLGDRLGAYRHGGEMITEIYVPRGALPDFLRDVAADFRASRAELIYGTVRLIERDTESFLAWAREPYACIIFNLHVTPTDAGIAKATQDFRGLIDRGLSYGGSYYLTYHRWADREQVLAAYPRFPEFLHQKRRFDPDERFQSDWYRHHKALIGR